MKFKAGDRVKAACDIWQDADEDHPVSKYASKGDELIVRVGNDPPNENHWSVYVSHPNRNDSFGVMLNEITH